MTAYEYLLGIVIAHHFDKQAIAAVHMQTAVTAYFSNQKLFACASQNGIMKWMTRVKLLQHVGHYICRQYIMEPDNKILRIAHI